MADGVGKSFLKSPQGQQLILVFIVGGVAWLAWRKYKKALDVTSPENVANKTFEKIGAEVTGNPNWTLTDQLLNTFPFLKSAAEKQFEAQQRGEKVINP